MYAGCVSGAIQLDDYLMIMEKAGLKNIDIQKMKPIQIPDNILLKYLNSSQLDEFKLSKVGIYSVTVYAIKPLECGVNCNC